MILTLKNIGKIKDAIVELNGITVIAGENNTGKSTVGKTLFCIFNSFYTIKEQIQKERKNAIKRILDIGYFSFENRVTRGFEIEELVDNILDKKDVYNKNIQLLESDIIRFFQGNNREFDKYISEIPFEDISKKMFSIISLSDETIFKTVLTKKLDSEFNGQINNIYSSDEMGIVELNIKGTNIKILIEDNEVRSISEEINLNTEVIYIDDPFIVDEIKPIIPRANNYSTHRTHLHSKLRNINNDFSVKDAINEVIVSNKLNNVLSKINTICSGEMIRSTKLGMGYRDGNSEKILDIRNTSTGLKTFIILKTLLLNGSLEENGTLVLDEPEIHLHPEWQILFAEIIVLLQKEFNMHILLNTHSPYFLRAIQIYSAKYKIADKCKYYMAENLSEQAIIKDVTTSIDEVYTKLARPFEILEVERYSDD